MSSFNLYNILKTVLNEAVSQHEVENAIDNKKVIMMSYDDETNTHHLGKRWTEPYALVTLPNGDLGLRAFQYNGDTKRGVPHWKLFKLDRITSWSPTNSKFTVDREGYNRLGDKQYVVIKQVTFNNDDVWLQRNLNNKKSENTQNNFDNFGRKINRKSPSVPNNQQGAIPNPTTMSVMNPSQQTQSGPVQQTDAMRKAKQHDWKKAQDLQYRNNRREKEKAEKLRKQAFNDDEEEMLNSMDNGAWFNN